MGFERDPYSLRQRVENHLPDVVAVACVAGPGVTEPDYEIRRITQLLPRWLRPLTGQRRLQQRLRLARQLEGLALRQQEA